MSLTIFQAKMEAEATAIATATVKAMVMAMAAAIKTTKIHPRVAPMPPTEPTNLQSKLHDVHMLIFVKRLYFCP